MNLSWRLFAKIFLRLIFEMHMHFSRPSVLPKRAIKERDDVSFSAEASYNTTQAKVKF